MGEFQYKEAVMINSDLNPNSFDQAVRREVI